MTNNEFRELIVDIVREACALKDKHTEERGAPVSYAAIFSHSREEYEHLSQLAAQIGAVHERTPTGPLFKIAPIDTVAGPLRLLKIRIPDQTRPERGDADFAVGHYPSFKVAMLQRPHCKLIQRDTFEMIELVDPAFNVRAYFSDPPVEKQHGLS